ncbi:MAG: hypothetical protein HC819_19775 [Cyclobacteriaceae bacterium]|nr:hypothetical protein [Cyclobacteriaceae bacterium]
MKNISLLLVSILLLQACIGTDLVDDFVEAKIVIENPISSLKVDSSYQFKALYFNNVGKPAEASFQWSSSDENILQITSNGLATGMAEGESTILVAANGIFATLSLLVNDTTIIVQDERVAVLATVSSYPLTGNAILKKQGGKTLLEFDERFNTTSALPGLYVYLTNNVNTINNALEVAKVKAFSGAQIYEISEDISLNEYDYVLFYCKPFLVPVGNGQLKP